jgi:hypothetical protein
MCGTETANTRARLYSLVDAALYVTDMKSDHNGQACAGIAPLLNI